MLAATMVLPASATAQIYADVSADSTHAVSIARLDAAEVFQGFADGTFRPAETVTRGQFATIVARSMGLTEAESTDAFDDIAGTTHAGWIQALFDQGAVRGFTDGSFRPSAPVTRGQSASMLVELFDIDPSTAAVPSPDAPRFSDVPGTTHEAAIDVLADLGVLWGDTSGRFLPSQTLRRDAAASVLARTIDRSVVDVAFGDGGSIADAVLTNNQARGIAVDQDGHLYSVGHSWTDDTFADFGNHLIRRTADGRIDSDFGDGGVVAIDGPVPAFWEFLRPVPLDDGRVAVVGNAMTISAVAYVSADGAIDADRGDSGYAVFEASDDTEPGFMAFDVATDDQGRLLVVGDRFLMTEDGGPDASSRLGFVARLAADGTLDASFGDGGLVIVDTDDGRVQLRSASIADDGSIAVAGRVLTDAGSELLLASLTADGLFDTGFGDRGLARPAPDLVDGRFGWELSHDADGGVVVVGNQGAFGSRDGFVLRTDADGQLDDGFGDGGMHLLADGFVTSLLVTDTHLWVGGQAGDIGADRGWSVWRLSLTGTPDPSFGLGGQSVLTFPSRATGEVIAGNVAGMTATVDGSVVLHGIDADSALRVVGLAP